MCSMKACRESAGGKCLTTTLDRAEESFIAPESGGGARRSELELDADNGDDGDSPPKVPVSKSPAESVPESLEKTSWTIGGGNESDAEGTEGGSSCRDGVGARARRAC